MQCGLVKNTLLRIAFPAILSVWEATLYSYRVLDRVTTRNSRLNYLLLVSVLPLAIVVGKSKKTLQNHCLNTTLYFPVYGLHMPIYGSYLSQYGKIRDRIQAFFALCSAANITIALNSIKDYVKNAKQCQIKVNLAKMKANTDNANHKERDLLFHHRKYQACNSMT